MATVKEALARLDGEITRQVEQMSVSTDARDVIREFQNGNRAHAAKLAEILGRPVDHTFNGIRDALNEVAARGLAA